jgi:Domain of unknown function (DUF6134)
MTRALARILAAAALLAAPAAPGAAQSFLDQGVLTITRDGVEIGREEFAIRATAGHPGFLAVATDTYRDREARVALELSEDREPVTYQVDVSVRGRVVERLSGQLGRGRFAVRLANQRGETVREFPVPPHIAVLDDDGFDQFAFLPRPVPGASLPVTLLVPRATRVVAASVRALGTDSVRVAGRPIPAQHYVLTLPGGETRDFWCSSAGELLQVAIPARTIVATRTAPPPLQ